MRNIFFWCFLASVTACAPSQSTGDVKLSEAGSKERLRVCEHGVSQAHEKQRWYLESLNGERLDDKETVLIARDTVVGPFDGSFVGNLSCNVYSFAYFRQSRSDYILPVEADGIVAFVPPTVIGCPPEKSPKSYRGLTPALYRASKFTCVGSKLSFSDGSIETVVFAPLLDQ